MDVLKKFAAYYKPYKKFFFLDLFCATIISAVDLAFPQILRRAASDCLFTRGQGSHPAHALPLLFVRPSGPYIRDPDPLQILCDLPGPSSWATWIERDMRSGSVRSL